MQVYVRDNDMNSALPFSRGGSNARERFVK